MSFFESKNLLRYAVALTVLGVVTYYGKQITSNLYGDQPDTDYKLVKQYLLTDSSLFGNNKPKLWIHTKYEINARKWWDFGSRNTTDLNQPYIHLTIQSIINHCSQDFHILLIDDDSFGKLMDDWEIDLKTVSEPEKNHLRQYAIAKLIWKYGGMTIPNSFICLKNLKEMWNKGCEANKPFVVENINRTGTITLKSKFIPDMYFLGCKHAKSAGMDEFIQFLHRRCISAQLLSSVEGEFTGDVQNWLAIAHHRGLFDVLPGELVGVKTAKKQQPILIEDWMGEKEVDLSLDCFGIYIPACELLRRPKYQWFTVMNTEDILKSNMVISEYIREATVDATSEYGSDVAVKNSQIGGI